MESEPKPIKIKKATFDDLKHALGMGFKDFFKAPQFGLFFGGCYALCGLLMFAGIFWADMLWLSYPMVIGFALIGPFIATGLYDVSRRIESEEILSWSGILGVIWIQHKRELGWMAFVMLFIFWIWIYQVRTLVAVFFGSSGFASFDDLLAQILFTTTGWNFLITGHIVGAIISLVLFAITVISCPLLLDRDVDFVTAMVTSIRTVISSPIVMIGWGAFVIVVVILSAVPAFLGLLLALPVVGHATWHLYRRLIS